MTTESRRGRPPGARHLRGVRGPHRPGPEPAVIRRVSDHSAELLRYLDELDLRLGTRVEIREKVPFQGPR